MNSYKICPECGACAYARDRYSNGHYCFPSQGGCGTKFPAQIEKVNGLFRHIITVNQFLKIDTTAYFHDFYIPPRNGGGKFTELVLAIKGKSASGIEAAKRVVSEIIKEDLDKLIDDNDKYRKERPVVIVVPRSKPDGFWQSHELQFKPAVSLGLHKSKYNVKGMDSKWIIDGTQYLARTKVTLTTHKAHLNDETNTGPPPYPGITRDTCKLDGDILNKNIILVDDIYTENKGIDEDCVQFLLDSGAADVVLYTLGKTKKTATKTPADATSFDVFF